MRKLMFFIVYFAFMTIYASANLLQILYFSNSIFKPKKNVVIFLNSKNQKSPVSNYVTAAKASLKLNITVVDINKITDIPKYSPKYIKKAEYIIILSDSATFNSTGKKYIIRKALTKKIPIITDKNSDNPKGALITIEGKSKLINSRVAKILNITIPPDIKAKQGVTIK